MGRYRIGIDAGSKTVKLVAIDEGGKLILCFYRRHRANIKDTVVWLLNRARQRHWNVTGSVRITGSAGLRLAEVLGIPFVQEVEASAQAVRTLLPEANAFIELGGEDAKIVYLDEPVEQRMNATCAGGTGSFIDTISFMLGLSPAELSREAERAETIYPLASRCAVFAQTDVRPLLNAGARKGDLAASVLQAVVNQTVGGLACGRPLRGTVAFLGGPCEFLPSLVDRFRQTLNLDGKTGIKPEFAQFYVAIGAALHAEGGPEFSLNDLAEALSQADLTSDELERCPPLFADEAEMEAFRARHERRRRRTEDGKPTLQDHIDFLDQAFSHLGDPPSPNSGDARANPWEDAELYLGIDAGSTALKLALVDAEGRLVRSGSEQLSGDLLRSLAQLLRKTLAGIPRDKQGDLSVRIRHACVTGYGEDMLKAALRLDSSVVETMAHLAAAKAAVPAADFILDIGGQDIKALWLKDGRIDKVVVNEACSSGCGSLIEGFAHQFRQSHQSFAQAALRGKNPVDLGVRCTVFMTSRVRHAQKAGAGMEDIAAGLAYSVVRNALFKVIGVGNLDTLGDTVVVQGGTFMSDAVLRAFELVSGKKVVRPAFADVMGAYGAALIARRRGAGQEESSMVPLSEALRLAPRQRTAHCPGCANACLLTISEFPDGAGGWRTCASGGRCTRGALLAAGEGAEAQRAAARETGTNLCEVRRRLIDRLSREARAAGKGRSAAGSSPRPRMGLPRALGLYASQPFWNAFFDSLGYEVMPPDRPSEQAERVGLSSIPSESACHPAKLLHLQTADLALRGADEVFLPRFAREGRCPLFCDAGRAVAENMVELSELGVRVRQPLLRNDDPELLAGDEQDRRALSRALGCEEAAIGRALEAGLRAQRQLRRLMARAARQALNRMEKEGGRGIVMAGRPYHLDADASHGTDAIMASLGYTVIPADALDALDGEERLVGDAHAGSNGPAAHAADSAHADDADPKPADAQESPWSAVRALERAAAWAAKRERMDFVQLYSFGCSIDAIESHRARSIIEGAGKQWTSLKMDGMVDLAHIRIRLRTLDAALREEDASNGGECVQGKAARMPAGRKTGSEETTRERAASAMRPEKAKAIELEPFSPDDVARGLSLFDGDVCYPVTALVGQAARAAEGKDAPVSFALPRICTSCLMDALPAAAAAAAPASPLARLSWQFGKMDPAAYARRAAEGRQAAANAQDAEPASGQDGGPMDGKGGKPADGGMPLVGVLGNLLLCFDRHLNRSLASLIESEGCRAVLPDPALLIGDDVGFPAQLDRFEQQGVRDIIYVQAFGCVKGHTQTRGALRRWRAERPNLRITVIDYDAGTSLVNQQNRVKLAIAEAKRQKKQLR